MAITTKLGFFRRAASILCFSLYVCMVSSVLSGAHLSAQNAQQGSDQQSAEPSAPAVPVLAQNIPIGPGDLLNVEVFNTPELSTALRVDQQGKITLPLGGDVQVQGLKVAGAAKAIEDALTSHQIMLHPVVMVNIVEYATKGVTVLGEVRSPGIYTLLGPHSLYDALAAAGGASQNEGATITITHAGDADHPEIVRVTTPNYSAIQKATVVQPGDTIMVSRADLVYIVGDVGRSGAFYLPNGQKMTVLTLLSLANGTNRTAKLSDSALVRELPDGSIQRVKFDLGKVMKSKQQNLVLRAGDIIVVPRSEWKNFLLTVTPGLVTNTASIVSSAYAYQ